MHLLRTTLTASTLILATAATTTVHADPPVYQYNGLGTLGGQGSVAFGLNDHGDVVGWSNPTGAGVCNDHICRNAFLWSGGVMTDLGKLFGDEESIARAINNAGRIVGTSERDVIAGSGTFHGVKWDAGVIAALPDLGQGQSFAHDVNESGTIVGHTQNPSTNRDTVVTWDGISVTDIGASEPHQYSRGHGISDAGIVVGMAWNLFSPNDAILYDGLGWTQIGGFGQFQNAEAYDVNDAGFAAGYMAFPSGSWHACVWTGGSAVDAGALPGMDTGELFSINSAGEAVGRSYSDPASSRAIYWDGAQLHDLNDLLPVSFAGVLIEAMAINENGEIAGTALVDGNLEAFLLTLSAPCPEDLDGNTEVGFSDVLAIIAAWGPCVGECPEDLSGNGVVDFADILAVIGAWGPCSE
ncbi:MAG: hypothetical protein ACYTGP_05430 [Planctomycetota bacterium]|jgi:probable HAF family extracellular repeat protein